jgi:hypothetical protein
MIRNLAQCPYCGNCEITLDDRPALVFNPDSGQGPCAHLVWVDGRYSQWDRSPAGINRMVGSFEFRWDPAEAGAVERTEEFMPYLRELLNQGETWPFAPLVPFNLQPLSSEEKATDAHGKQYTVADVDGGAIFAENPESFWAAVPECQEKHLASLDVEEAGEA